MYPINFNFLAIITAIAICIITMSLYVAMCPGRHAIMHKAVLDFVRLNLVKVYFSLLVDDLTKEPFLLFDFNYVLF